MTTVTLSSPSDSPIWANLKLAIADSSGFKCWQDDHGDESLSLEDHIAPQLLDSQVRRYLRQTLETLAY